MLTSVTGTDYTLESSSYRGSVLQYLHAALATVATVPNGNNMRQMLGLLFCVIPAVEYRKQLSCSYMCVCIYVCTYYVYMYVCMLDFLRQTNINEHIKDFNLFTKKENCSAQSLCSCEGRTAA